MKVSIIMLTYNHEKYISDAIEGVLLQETNFTFELIVANDCSVDGTEQLIESYRKKNPEIVKGFNNKKNIGPKLNFVKAYGEARGEYIAMCEGDDYWTDPLKLQQQFDFLEKNKDYVLTFHDIAMIDAEGNNIELDRLQEKDKKDYEKDGLLMGPYLPTPTLFFRKFDIKKFVSAFSKAFNGDSLLLSILTQKGMTKYQSNIKVAVVRVHSGGVWSSTTYLDRWNHSLKTLEIIFESLNSKTRTYIFEHYNKSFEMASWDADFYNSHEHWMQYNKQYVSFLMKAGQYGKTWLVVRRIIKRVLEKK